jgi:hypothetical protein
MARNRSFIIPLLQSDKRAARVDVCGVLREDCVHLGTNEGREREKEREREREVSERTKEKLSSFFLSPSYSVVRECDEES